MTGNEEKKNQEITIDLTPMVVGMVIIAVVAIIAIMIVALKR